RKQQNTKLKPRSITSALKSYEAETGKSLTAEQHKAIMHILKSDRISCIIGRAGTGKSFLLGAAKTVWESTGFDVYGVALSGIAADGLNKDAGINSRTIESFRYALKNEQSMLSKRSVVVMDEAGMTDTHSMLAILEAVKKSGAKLVLVGDHAQI